jgi:8-oxo-dGTP pyrophosphatase MutT (NUDIX family)
MKEDKFVWKEESREKVFDSRVFSVYESRCRLPDDELRAYTVIDAPDWAIVVPVLETPQPRTEVRQDRGSPLLGRQFVMVRQWRHGSRSMSLEFPGGVFEPGENPEDAAARELQEETGYRPGSIRKIGEFSPNPAIMSNKVHFFLAEDLVDTGKQELDADEFVEIELVDIDEVKMGMGKPPFVHALMGSALVLYLQRQNYLNGS